MTFRVLWPIMRWPDDWRIESEAVGEGVRAEFVDRFENVTDDQWRNCDGIVSGVDVPAQYRAKLEKCRIFVKPAVGFDNIDLKAWGELGIPVCNVPDYGTMEVADHAMALMLTLMKGIEFHTFELRANPKGNWRPALNPYGRRLSACTFGVVGIGRIGTAAALRAKAFGMDVVFYDPYVSNGVDLALGIRRVHSLEDLLRQSDVVSVHVPLSDQTRKLVGRQSVRRFQTGIDSGEHRARRSHRSRRAVRRDARRQGTGRRSRRSAGGTGGPGSPADQGVQPRNEEWIAHRLVMTPHSAFFTPESVFDMRAKSARSGGDVPARRTHAELRQRQFLRRSSRVVRLIQATAERTPPTLPRRLTRLVLDLTQISVQHRAVDHRIVRGPVQRLGDFFRCDQAAVSRHRSHLRRAPPPARVRGTFRCR